MPAQTSTIPIGDGMLRTSGAATDIAFRADGEGPAVVLLHGTSASHAVWEPVVEELRSRATVIALDQRGHGRSDKPATGYGAAEFADDVITVLDALGIPRAIVAGHSLGGRNAWVAAARHSRRVSAVVCVDYTPFVSADVLDELDRRVAGGHRSFAGPAEVEQYLASRYVRIPAEAVRRRAAGGYCRADDGSWWPRADPTAMTQLIQGFRTPWLDAFRAVTVPMTHLRGAESRIVDDAAWSAAMNERPGDRWLTVDDADHYIPEEQPDLVAGEIARLLPLIP